MPDAPEKAATAVMCFSGGTGGMEITSVRLANLLSKIAAVDYFCKRGSFAEQRARDADGAFLCNPIRFHSRVFSPSMLLAVRRIIKRRNIRNVIFLGASELKTLHFAFAGLGINLIVWHGTTKSKPKRDALHRLVYSGVNTHVTISRHLLENVKTIVPATPGVQFSLIMPSVTIDMPRMDDTPARRPPLQILHIGRVAAGKGQIDAVHACAALKKDETDFRLTLVGGADDEACMNALEAAVENSGFRDAVTLAGHVAPAAIPAYLRRADIFLFPSRGEGMPGAFIEALLYGLPCIAYSNTVFPEYADMGFRVTLAGDGNVAELAQCLLRVAADIDRERQLSRDNARLARETFNAARELDSWREILV